MSSKASARNIQLFILGEKAKLNSRLTCCGVSLCELAQFFVRNSKFSSATIQTNNNLWKYPHNGLVNIFQSEKMDAHLRAEFLLVD